MYYFPTRRDETFCVTFLYALMVHSFDVRLYFRVMTIASNSQCSRVLDDKKLRVREVGPKGL